MTFLTKVEDFDGNITDLEEKAILTPLFEEMIDKSTWTLMSQLSVNGDAWEGETTAFWDDIVDTAETNSDNSYFIIWSCLLYTSPSPRDGLLSRMPSSA